MKEALLIAVDRLSKIYHTRTGLITALEDIDFAIGEGQFVAIVGPSGCGKSTLLKILTGLIPASQGQARLRGTPIVGPRRDIGVVFQSPVLFPWRTVLGNVMLPVDVQRLGREQLQQSAMNLLALVGLQGFERRYPWELSGGMQQRASLCRSLIHEPALLMLDEPFGALDAFTREELWDVLQELWMRRGFTTILVTHDLREAVYLADTVHVMSSRPGRIIATHDVPIERPRRPRTAYEARFMDIVASIREEIRGERNEQPPAGAHA
jgi:NitT/TauT family transport system ATP-binding protein